MHVSHRLSVQKISERTVVFAAGHAVPVRERPRRLLAYIARNMRCRFTKSGATVTAHALA